MGPSPGCGSAPVNMHYNLAQRRRLKRLSNHPFLTTSQNEWYNHQYIWAVVNKLASTVCRFLLRIIFIQKKIFLNRNTQKHIEMYCVTWVSLPLPLFLSSHLLALATSLSLTHSLKLILAHTHNHPHTHMYWSRVRLYLIGYLYGNAAGCMSHFLISSSFVFSLQQHLHVLCLYRDKAI